MRRSDAGILSCMSAALGASGSGMLADALPLCLSFVFFGLGVVGCAAAASGGGECCSAQRQAAFLAPSAR